MKKLRFFGTFLSMAAVGLVIVLTLTAAVPAQDLPPRPPTPTPAPESEAPPRGAQIILRAWNAPLGAWTVVQWQDALGGWHDVDGWRGHLDDSAGTEKIWWVAPKDFNTGPFRWLVYAQPGGELLGVSDAFHLPSRSGEIVAVAVVLP